MSGNGSEEESQQQGQEGKTTEGSVLRTKLEDTLTENQALKGQLLIFQSGLGHLNEKQQRALVREASEGGAELTAELLKATAKELGYAEAPKQEAKGEGGEGGEGGNEGNNGNEGSPGAAEVVETALNSMHAIDIAARQALPDTDPLSFENKLKAAKSADEVMALIRSEGHKVGIVSELDVE